MSSEIPDRQDGWIKGGPWIFTDRGFFHATEAHYKGKIPLVSFEVHLEHNFFGTPVPGYTRFVHECAHMIACKDENLFKPTWDFDEFLVGEKPTPFTDAAAEKEIEVMVLDQMLSNHWNHPFRFEHPVNSSISRIRSYTKLDKKTIEETAEFWYQNWTIELAWAELQRKYKMIADGRK